MKTELQPADAVLEPELRELCYDTSAVDRVKLAQKFQRWVDQLTQSAMITDPDLVPVVPAPKVPRGFILVNLSKDERDELRELARQCGYNLSGLIQSGIRLIKHSTKERVEHARLMGVHPMNAGMLMHGRVEN